MWTAQRITALLTSRFAARNAVRFSAVVLSLTFMGALDNCDPTPPTCTLIEVACGEGEVLTDTDGDGCEDTCMPQEGCFVDGDCSTGERCDTDNYCTMPACDEGMDCLAVCMGQCVPESCDGGLIDCEPGYIAVDTNDDGCVDSCEPEVNCLAIPVCDEGDVEVEGPSGCLQDDATCYERTECGTTIWCTGPDAPQGCYANEDCDVGQVCDTENYCDAADCGGESDCLVACLGRCIDVVVCDDAELQCEDNEIPVDSDGDGCADSCEALDECQAYPSCHVGDEEVSEETCEIIDAECYSVEMCGYTIFCTEGPTEECAAVPVCDEGDEEVEPELCEVIDAECYEVTMCGTTITCAG